MNYKIIIVFLFVFISHGFAFGSPACVDVLTGRDPEIQSWLDQELLEAVKTGDLQDVTYLISEGADLNVTNRYLSTPLHVAIREGHYDVVELLLEKGAGVNAKNVYGNTPLHVAVSAKQTTMIELFLRKKAAGLHIGFDIKNNGDEDNPDGYTPIELAEKQNPITIAKLLSGEFTPRKRPPTELDVELLEAVKTGDLKRVHKLIEEDPDVVHARTQDWGTPLHVAIQAGHYDIVELLIEKGADVNAKNVHGNTPLHTAVSARQTTMIELFLRKKVEGLNVDLDIKNNGDEDNPDGYTPIELAEKQHPITIAKLLSGEFTPRKRPPTELDVELLEAVKTGDLKRVHELIEEDPDVVHAKNQYWGTPLHVAIQAGHYDIVELLIEKGADVNAKNVHGNTPLHTAVSARQTTMIELFLRKKAAGLHIGFDIKNNGDEDNPDGYTPIELAEKRNATIITKLLSGEFAPRKRPLADNDIRILEASENGNLEEVHKLIEKDPDVVHARNQHWSTPLHVAIQVGHYDVVELLIEKGADVNAKNVHGNTPLHIVVIVGETVFVKLLIRNNAKVDIKNGNEKTPIEIAKERGRGRIRTFLEDGGELRTNEVSLTWLDKELIKAVEMGNLGEIRELIENQDANIDVRNPKGKSTLLHLAAKIGSYDVVELLIEKAPDLLNAKTVHLNTPLHVAIQEGQYDIVELLIEKGADVNAKNVHGNTPLHVAVMHGQITIIEFFLRKKAEGLNVDLDIKNNKKETPIELAEKRNSIIITKLLSGEFASRKKPPTELDVELLEAVKTGNLEEVHKLIEEDPDVVHARTREWSTPLHVAIQAGHYDIVELLIEKGADINAKNINGNTPLHTAVSQEQTTMIELFLRKKAAGLDIGFDIKNNGDEDNPDGYTPIELAEKQNSIIIAKLLSGEFAPRKRPPTELDVELLEAVKTGDLKRVHKIIEEDPDVVHARTQNWGTPLHVAIQYRHYDIVELLIDKGADVNARNVRGNTPLHIAVNDKQITTVELFLRKKVEGLNVDLDIKNNGDEDNPDGHTPFELAEKRNFTIIKKLLSGEFTPRKSLPTELDVELLEAVKTGKLEEVRKLIEEDSDVVHARNEHWGTPLHVATQYRHNDIVELLIEKGADVNARNVRGNTPLHTAVRISFYEAIDILLTIEELIVDEVNDKGETALDLAAQTENEVIFDLLVDKFFPKGPLASVIRQSEPGIQ